MGLAGAIPASQNGPRLALMHSLIAFYRSTVGKKIIMAVTGLIGIGFVIAHMAGNLQVFAGPRKLNDYGAMLHGPLGDILWLFRAVLIVAVVLHVTMAVQLRRRSAAARPIGYRERAPQVSTLASRTMLAGGVLLLIFVVVHILHFTTLRIDPAGWAGRTDAAGERDVYGNVVASFRIWWVSAFYIVSMLALGLHLYHGAWSSVRTLGYAAPSAHPLRRRAALGLAVVVWLGFTLVPVGVMAGIIR
jgi:succinate dehydrogenase cytochrome b subunit